MSRPLKYLTAALLWAAVAGYVIWSAAAALACVPPTRKYTLA